MENNRPGKLSRRIFFKQGALGGTGLMLTGKLPSPPGHDASPAPSYVLPLPQSQPVPSSGLALDLSPARWIWFPSGRTLPNTFVLFIKKFTLQQQPVSAQGWLLGDSRYQLFVNNRRVQWGPSPADPRWPEADPVDLTTLLQVGVNHLALQVLYFGQGDGTLPIGKPGVIFNLEIKDRQGNAQRIISDATWRCHVPRSWQPGHYKRWYLRALQEEFDARLHPHQWMHPDFTPDHHWVEALELDCPADKPALCSSYPDYLHDIGNAAENAQLRARSIPLLRETDVPAKKLTETLRLTWKKSLVEYFEFVTPDAYQADRPADVRKTDAASWVVNLNGESSAALVFEFEEQLVGWPYFTIQAPAGTTVELLVQEGHQPGGAALLNSHFNSWARFICKEGTNRFEGFDFESLRWLQLHIHNARGQVVVSNVGVRRRIFPWPHPATIRCANAVLQKLVAASVNTLYNCAQETLVDGMGRERQQYSGDVGHQLHALYHTFGEKRLPARYLTTFSQGMTTDGFFLDCWPAYDRLARLMERQLQLTPWGPLLDHGIGFNFDCYHHYMYTGDVTTLDEVFPRLLRFFNYLLSIRGKDGLLPVEHIGVPTVWIDHQAYKKQKHKQCAFNLYAAAMCSHALFPLCKVLGNVDFARRINAFGEDLLGAAVKSFWSPQHNLFIDNLPWLDEEKEIRYSDRALSTAILYDQIPGKNEEVAVQALVNCPAQMGYSYPANAGWRFWALAKAGRIDAVLKDLDERWGSLESVSLNNTLQEDWSVQPDSNSQWSHCAVVPLYILFTSIAGLEPLEPGFKRFRLRPQLGTLEKLELTSHIFNPGLILKAEGVLGKRTLALQIPEGYEGVLVLDEKEQVTLKEIHGDKRNGLKNYMLKGNSKVHLDLRFT